MTNIYLLYVIPSLSRCHNWQKLKQECHFEHLSFHLSSWFPSATNLRDVTPLLFVGGGRRPRVALLWSHVRKCGPALLEESQHQSVPGETKLKITFLLSLSGTLFLPRQCAARGRWKVCLHFNPSRFCRIQSIWMITGMSASQCRRTVRRSPPSSTSSSSLPPSSSRRRPMSGGGMVAERWDKKKIQSHTTIQHLYPVLQSPIPLQVHITCRVRAHPAAQV